MRKQQAVWKLISNSLHQNIPVMLLYVLKSSGSSPGRKGFLMAVNKLGQMEGSIGGGIMEHKFVEMARNQLQHNEPVIELKQQVHDKAAAKNQSGMICSGEQTIFLYHVKVTDATDIQNLLISLEENKNGLLRLSPTGLEFHEQNTNNQQDTFTMQSEYDWLYEEVTGYKNYIHIVGGGHCALALSWMMNVQGFHITVYDERPLLNTIIQNEYAHKKITVNSYSELGRFIPDGKNQYIVIMTAGYRTDDLAIQTLLNKDVKYFGVLGSKKKMKKLFAEYSAMGISQQLLKNIHSPIGIPIKSQTPEEIAVSIAAEITKVKNKNL